MIAKYLEESGKVYKQKCENSYRAKCELLEYEQKLVSIDKSIKGMSFFSKMFNKEKLEERNHIVEMIQQLISNLKTAKKEESDVKKYITDYVRKKVLEENENYEIKYDDLNFELEKANKVFKAINELNDLSISALDSFRNIVNSVNKYYEYSRIAGATQLLSDICVNESNKYLQQGYSALEKLNQMLPTALGVIKNIDNDIDLNKIELAIERMKSSEHRLIERSNTVRDFAHQFKRFNNVIAVIEAVYTLIHEDALRFHKVKLGLVENIKSLDSEINIEINFILTANGIDVKEND